MQALLNKVYHYNYDSKYIELKYKLKDIHNYM
ncbi:hypothetical protein M118_4291, partial [Bacteroides fragilis str. 3783N1-2]